MNIYEKLNKIQTELKAPKNNFNKFGNYNYRSAEDIIEALKPYLSTLKCVLIIEDEVAGGNDRVYIKATAKLINAEKPEEVIETSAFAREQDKQAGMADAQLTGSTSSYARKYALNGLFALDDVKDADSTNTHQKPQSKSTSQTGKITEAQIKRLYAIALKSGFTADQVKAAALKDYDRKVEEMDKVMYDRLVDRLEKAGKKQ